MMRLFYSYIYLSATFRGFHPWKVEFCGCYCVWSEGMRSFHWISGQQSMWSFLFLPFPDATLPLLLLLLLNQYLRVDGATDENIMMWLRDVASRRLRCQNRRCSFGSHHHTQGSKEPDLFRGLYRRRLEQSRRLIKSRGVTEQLLSPEYCAHYNNGQSAESRPRAGAAGTGKGESAGQRKGAGTRVLSRSGLLARAGTF